ncbi:MAG: helix-turn-helix transcriptional regulator [Elusimicrobia bacterium]|nr:helix-turn-helix transcriptional regulator [Elusimicrobiota bacterium]
MLIASMAKNIYEVLSERIKEERLRSGWTIERLAENAGISPSFLACLIVNKRKPSIETAAKIAKALDMPVSKLFEETHAKQSETGNLKQRITHLLTSTKPAHQKIMLSMLKELSKNLNKR